MGVFVFALLLHGSTARAAELIMFESAFCEWCEQWHADIGPIYPKTQEGACAPLRSINLDEPRPEELENIGGIRFTPTFVLVEDGREIGRIIGYPGEDFFWPLLAEKLDELSVPCPS